MPVQIEAPVTIKFRFRRYDEDGEDIGPLNLTDAEHLPIAVDLKPPGQTVREILQANITITDAVNGLAEYEAAPGEIDFKGRWQAQAWAGDWPSNVVTFQVDGPNL